MKIVNFNINDIHEISNLSIVIVREKDFITFKKYIKRKHITPYKVYKVLSYIEGYEELIAYYLKYKYYKHYHLDKKLKVLIQWDNIIKLFNQRKYKCLLEYIDNLEDIGLLLNTNMIVRSIKKLITNVELPLIDNGLFLNIDYSKKKFGNQNCLSDNFFIVQKLKNISFCTYNWNEFNEYVNNIITNIPNNSHETDYFQNRLFFISIYFYRLSEIYRINGSYIVSYNMLHRVMDIFLYYLCKKHMSISDCGRHLKDKFDNLKNGSYSFTTFEEYMIIEKLNKSRNKLYVAHGLYSIQKNELYEMHSFIKKFIKDKDGSAWNNKLKELQFKHKLKPLDLFMYEPSFNTYFIEVT